MLAGIDQRRDELEADQQSLLEELGWMCIPNLQHGGDQSLAIFEEDLTRHLDVHEINMLIQHIPESLQAIHIPKIVKNKLRYIVGGPRPETRPRA